MADSHGLGNVATLEAHQQAVVDTMIRCFLINLKQSKARLDHMRKAFGDSGIEFERHEAVDAARVREHAAYLRVPALRGREWAPAEVACLLSHYDVWTRIATGVEPFGAVFEDDLHIDPRLREVLAASNIPLHADVVKLETVGKLVAIARVQRQGPAGVCFARLFSLHHGSGAYIISRQAAQKAVRSVELFDLPVDDAIFSPQHPFGRTLRRYQLVPALAIQDIILPKAQQITGLESIVEPERRIRAATRMEGELPRKPRNRLFPLHNLPLRIAGAAWRRVWWRYTVVPFGTNQSGGRAKV